MCTEAVSFIGDLHGESMFSGLIPPLLRVDAPFSGVPSPFFTTIRFLILLMFQRIPEKNGEDPKPEYLFAFHPRTLLAT